VEKIGEGTLTDAETAPFKAGPDAFAQCPVLLFHISTHSLVLLHVEIDAQHAQILIWTHYFRFGTARSGMGRLMKPLQAFLPPVFLDFLGELLISAMKSHTTGGAAVLGAVCPRDMIPNPAVRMTRRGT